MRVRFAGVFALARAGFVATAAASVPAAWVWPIRVCRRSLSTTMPWREITLLLRRPWSRLDHAVSVVPMLLARAAWLPISLYLPSAPAVNKDGSFRAADRVVSVFSWGLIGTRF